MPSVSVCALSLIVPAYDVNVWFFWLDFVLSFVFYVREKDLRQGIVTGVVASLWMLHGLIVLVRWLRVGTDDCAQVRFQKGFADVV